MSVVAAEQKWVRLSEVKSASANQSGWWKIGKKTDSTLFWITKESSRKNWIEWVEIYLKHVHVEDGDGRVSAKN